MDIYNKDSKGNITIERTIPVIKKKKYIENDKNDSTIDIVKGEKWKRIQSGDNDIDKCIWIDNMCKKYNIWI